MKLKLLLLLFMVVSIITACSNESQDAVKNIRQKVGDAIAGEATATPTTETEPSGESEPTSTPEPTPKTEPTATPEPTPTTEPDNCAPGKCSKNPVDEPLSVTFDEDGFYTKLIYGTSDFTLKINNIGSVILTIEITPTIPGIKNTIMIQPNESKNISLYESKQSPEYNGSITLNGSWQISGSEPLSQIVKVRIVNS